MVCFSSALRCVCPDRPSPRISSMKTSFNQISRIGTVIGLRGLTSIRGSVLLLGSVLLVACSSRPSHPSQGASASPPAGSSTTQVQNESVDEARTSFARAFEGNSVGRIRAFFERGARIRPPAGLVRTGGAASEDFAQLAVRLRARDVELSPSSVEVGEGEVAESGVWRWRIGNSTTQASYRMLWRLSPNGRWKIASLSWT